MLEKIFPFSQNRDQGNHNAGSSRHERTYQYPELLIRNVRFQRIIEG
jgi:hypothetical protein